MSAEEHTKQELIDLFERDVVQPIEDFQDPKQEWRRLFSELLGTFFLVLVAAGGGMMGQAFPNTITRSAAVTAPGLMVMAIILFMGKVSGAHLNPAVSLAFAARGDFPWRRVPGYIVVQLVGATLAALFLREVINVSATFGSNYPAAGYSAGSAFWMEFILTLGLVSVILGTASGAQNIGDHRRLRGGWLHRARRPLGQPHLGHVDEPGPHLRPRPRRSRLDELLGLRRRAPRRRGAGGGVRVRPPRTRRRQSRVRRRAGRAADRGRRARQGLNSPGTCPRHHGTCTCCGPVGQVTGAKGPYGGVLVFLVGIGLVAGSEVQRRRRTL